MELPDWVADPLERRGYLTAGQLAPFADGLDPGAEKSIADAWGKRQRDRALSLVRQAIDGLRSPATPAPAPQPVPTAAKARPAKAGKNGRADHRVKPAQAPRMPQDASAVGAARSVGDGAEGTSGGEPSRRERTIAELPEDLRHLMDDPAVNDAGVYSQPEEIEIPIPKSYGCGAVVRVALGNDGRWRGGYDVRDPLGRSSSPVGVRLSKPYGQRHEAILAACTSIEAVLRAARPKAADAIKRFAGGVKPAEGPPVKDGRCPQCGGYLDKPVPDWKPGSRSACHFCGQGKGREESPARPGPSRRQSDHTSQTEARLADRRFYAGGPYDEQRAQIAAWRERQAAGDTEPRWGEWSEFTITLADGSDVDVVHDPHWKARDPGHRGGMHLDYHGPLSETGYRSHFVGYGEDGERAAKMGLREYAELAAREIDEPKDKARRRKGRKEAKPAPGAARTASPRKRKPASVPPDDWEMGADAEPAPAADAFRSPPMPYRKGRTDGPVARRDYVVKGPDPETLAAMIAGTPAVDPRDLYTVVYDPATRGEWHRCHKCGGDHDAPRISAPEVACHYTRDEVLALAPCAAKGWQAASLAEAGFYRWLRAPLERQGVDTAGELHALIVRTRIADVPGLSAEQAGDVLAALAAFKRTAVDVEDDDPGPAAGEARQDVEPEREFEVLQGDEVLGTVSAFDETQATARACRAWPKLDLRTLVIRPAAAAEPAPDLSQVPLARLMLRLGTRLVLEKKGRIGTVAKLAEYLAHGYRRKSIQGLTPAMLDEARAALRAFLGEREPGVKLDLVDDGTPEGREAVAEASPEGGQAGAGRARQGEGDRGGGLMSEPMRAHDYLRQAQAVEDLAERDDLPPATIRPVKLPWDDEGMQVEWAAGDRAVVVTIARTLRLVECREGVRCWRGIDGRRGFVEAFRRSIAWMKGECERPT
jgi:hypothetical protein